MQAVCMVVTALTLQQVDLLLKMATEFNLTHTHVGEKSEPLSGALHSYGVRWPVVDISFDVSFHSFLMPCHWLCHTIVATGSGYFHIHTLHRCG